MVAVRVPAGLGAGGRALWRGVTEVHTLDHAQTVVLLEACRAKDRLDKLDAVLRGDADTWMRLALDPRSDGQVYELRIANALTKADQLATTLKQLLAALRLPDAKGVRPQQRGGARGAYATGAAKPAAKVSSLDRARERHTS